jgi:hypothetical protein
MPSMMAGPAVKAERWRGRMGRGWPHRAGASRTFPNFAGRRKGRENRAVFVSRVRLASGYDNKSAAEGDPAALSIVEDEGQWFW